MSAGNTLRTRRDIRPYVYGVLDALFATTYIVLFFSVVPTRHAGGQWLLGALTGALAITAGSMLVRHPWGWRVAVGGCVGLLVGTVVLLVLILWSSAVLAGVYGAFGRAAATLSLVFAALAIELVGLLPALQLKYLMTRAGRAHFRVGPSTATPS